MVLNHFFNLYGNPTPTLSKRPEKGKKKSSSEKYEKRKHQKQIFKIQKKRRV